MRPSTLVVNTPALTKDLTTIERLKAELSIADTASDTLLANLIREASDTINSFCRRPEGFGVETVTETFWLATSGHDDPLTRGPEALILSRDLNPAVASVTEDGTALTANTGFILDGSVLRRLSAGVTRRWAARQVVVAYSAGFVLLDGLPFDVERVALDLIGTMWAQRGRDFGIRSESVDGVASVSYLDPRAGAGGLPPHIADRLQPWRRFLV